ncbi:MAG: hypothetical protein IJ545_04130 [Alphaproteobacteria bacterium]|nr:hypothetical protein [Alphaproteobacteria bacterium]
MDKLKLIKSIVFIITFLLVFGSLMLLTVIYRKARPEPLSYRETSLMQPIGSRIDSVTKIDNQLAVVVKDGGQPDRIVIYNPQTLQKSATITLWDNDNEQ